MLGAKNAHPLPTGLADIPYQCMIILIETWFFFLLSSQTLSEVSLFFS
jgi:hypothetical protein